MNQPVRHASCRCGQIRIACAGEPIRVSVCHCRECKARSGSAFAVQVRFPAEQVHTEGEAKLWQYTGESGHTADFFFCPNCGSGVWYRARPHHDAYAVPLGNFEPDHGFAPEYSVWEDRKEPWVSITGAGIDHYD